MAARASLLSSGPRIACHPVFDHTDRMLLLLTTKALTLQPNTDGQRKDALASRSASPLSSGCCLPGR